METQIKPLRPRERMCMADLFDLMIRNSYYLKGYVEEEEITPHTVHNDLIQKSSTVLVLAQRNIFYGFLYSLILSLQYSRLLTKETCGHFYT
jgi:hypothetical protein